MILVESILTKNPCYTAGRKISVKGLMLHSVGCNQPKASVFINNWNSASYSNACVHGFIDALDGTVYQTLPWDHRGWHCASGNNGSGNNTHIGVEMCEPACIKYTGGASFTCSDMATAQACAKRTYEAAVELFAMLCKKFGLNPLADGVIISHKEGHARGIASNHGDPEHLWTQLKMGYTMDTFRKAVKANMDGGSASTQQPTAQVITPVSGASDEKKIWDFLFGKIGNAYGAAGMMGNLYAESGLKPTNLQNTYEKSLGMTDAEYTAKVDNGSYSNFVHDKAGYGLAQWTYYSRKQNLLDTLNCVRQLRQLNPPVGIYFEKENIDTLDATGELILTILSALAQDESRSISDNIRWSIQKKFQRGEAMVDLSRMLGYDKGPNGEWVINPEQAEIVRYIFERYVCGATANGICTELNEMGKKTARGCIWRADSVLYILRNEKYVGDLECQKTVTKNFLTHEPTLNTGEAPKYYVTDHHVAIIDRFTWDKAQAMMMESGFKQHAPKKEKKRRCNNASPFTNLICGVDDCGEKMFRLGYNTPVYSYTDERSAAAEGLNPEDYRERYYYYYPVWRCTRNAQGNKHHPNSNQECGRCRYCPECQL